MYKISSKFLFHRLSEMLDKTISIHQGLSSVVEVVKDVMRSRIEDLVYLEKKKN